MELHFIHFPTDLTIRSPQHTWGQDFLCITRYCLDAVDVLPNSSHRTASATLKFPVEPGARLCWTLRHLLLKDTRSHSQLQKCKAITKLLTALLQEKEEHSKDYVALNKWEIKRITQWSCLLFLSSNTAINSFPLCSQVTGTQQLHCNKNKSRIHKTYLLSKRLKLLPILHSLGAVERRNGSNLDITICFQNGVMC